MAISTISTLRLQCPFWVIISPYEYLACDDGSTLSLWPRRRSLCVGLVLTGAAMPLPPARFPVGNQKLRAQVGHMSNILGVLPLVVYAGWGSHAADGQPRGS